MFMQEYVFVWCMEGAHVCGRHYINNCLTQGREIHVGYKLDMQPCRITKSTFGNSWARLSWPWFIVLTHR